jgi:hypothetical protein
LSGLIKPVPDTMSTDLTVPVSASVRAAIELKARVILKRCMEDRIFELVGRRVCLLDGLIESERDELEFGLL